jgi:pimeloyl-ACP methyl ester carboxylesterase
MISLLLFGAVALLLISAALAPISALGWWAGWFGEGSAPQPGKAPRVAPAAGVRTAPHYLVYLSGIGAITADSVPEEEIKWLAAFERRVGDSYLVRDVFPYNVVGAGLTSERFFNRMWRYIEQLRFKDPNVALGAVINARNMLQVAVSADRRYGPIYNLGVADEIVASLQRHGYRLGSGVPVTLIGWSGGGQIALGATAFLHTMLKAPIRVVSIGGVMADDPGLVSMTHLYHFYGSHDPVQGLGGKLFAGRWPIFKQSVWNRALAQGKITFTELGPFSHNGKDNYFSWTAKTPAGESYAETTMDAIVGVLRADGLIHSK